MSLRLRLALAGAIAILAVLGLAAMGLSQLFSAHVERRAVAELGVQLDQVIAGLERDESGLVVARTPADPRFQQPYGGLYWQVEGPGGTERSRSLWDRALDLPSDTLGEGGVHIHHLEGPEGTGLLVLERSVTLTARLGGGMARAAVALDATELDLARRAFMVDIAPYLVLLALVLTVAGWAQLWIGLRPLRRLGTRVAALHTGQADRMGSDWPVELRPVADEIDKLLTARSAETARARTRAADLAHGLKTPLQALMGEAARLRKTGANAHADGIEDTVRAMRRTVDRELARARSAARAGDASADAAMVAKRLVAVLKRTPQGKQLDWKITISQGTHVALDPAELSEALGALAENAARHARSRVTFSARHEAETILLSVSDDGDGIPPELRAALMERHGRADESGTGLGLAIAAEIIEAAGGKLTLSDTEPGLTATLDLPRAISPDIKGRQK
ncbi:MAG: sensor histidine kinase [Alphaproteobacteria bacterium]|jgi:signal transduction histidine kinase|nr:sensor histidine kinase [Alphaproteobacteria bacterium]